MMLRDVIIELIEEGILDERNLTISLLKYMSEDDIVDCLRSNEIDYHVIDRINNEHS